MAAAIETAIQALTYKDADYTTVDEAIAKAKVLDVNLYKDFTAVNTAMNAVVRGKNIQIQIRRQTIQIRMVLSLKQIMQVRQMLHL